MVSSLATMVSKASRTCGPSPKCLARSTKRRICTVTSGNRSTVYLAGCSEDSSMRSISNELTAQFLQKFPERFFLAKLREDFFLVQGNLVAQEGDQGLGQLVPFGAELGNLLVQPVPFAIHFVQHFVPIMGKISCRGFFVHGSIS